MDDFRQEVRSVMDEAWEHREDDAAAQEVSMPSDDPDEPDASPLDERSPEQAQPPTAEADTDDAPPVEAMPDPAPADTADAEPLEPAARTEEPVQQGLDAPDQEPEPAADGLEPPEAQIEQASGPTLQSVEPAADVEPMGVDAYIGADLSSDPLALPASQETTSDAAPLAAPERETAPLDALQPLEPSGQSAPREAGQAPVINIQFPDGLVDDLMETLTPHLSQMRTDLLGRMQDAMIEAMQLLDRRSAL